MKWSSLLWKCRNEAIKNEGLMPCDCVEILAKNYGSRLERMKPSTIREMVESLMRTATSFIDKEQIEEAVQDYCNAF